MDKSSLARPAPSRGFGRPRLRRSGGLLLTMAHGGAASDSVFVPVLLLLLAGLLVGVVGGLVHLRNRLARTRASFGLAGLNLLYAVPLLLSNWGIVGYGLGLLLV